MFFRFLLFQFLLICFCYSLEIYCYPDYSSFLMNENGQNGYMTESSVTCFNLGGYYYKGNAGVNALYFDSLCVQKYRDVSNLECIYDESTLITGPVTASSSYSLDECRTNARNYYTFNIPLNCDNHTYIVENISPIVAEKNVTLISLDYKTVMVNEVSSLFTDVVADLLISTRTTELDLFRFETNTLLSSLKTEINNQNLNFTNINEINLRNIELNKQNTNLLNNIFTEILNIKEFINSQENVIQNLKREIIENNIIERNDSNKIAFSFLLLTIVIFIQILS